MSISVIDTIRSAGDFAVAVSEEIEHNGKRLDEVVDNKVEKESGKGLSTNDYSNAEKAKLSAAVTDISNLQNNKVEKVSGKGLSTNDYTNSEKSKVSNAESEIAKFNSYFTLVKGGN